MTPRVRLALPGLIVLGLALAPFAVPHAAEAAVPPCSERTSYGDCRPADECIGTNMVCECDWDSHDLVDIGVEIIDNCLGKNEAEPDATECKFWDAEKYPDQPFCTPKSSNCEERVSLLGCVHDSCLEWRLPDGSPCSPGQVNCRVYQDQCFCNWDHEDVYIAEIGETYCNTDFNDEYELSICQNQTNGSAPFCTTNPLRCTPQPRCDVDANGQIDSVDVDAIYARLGQAATDECDPADATQSGTISIVDASQCSGQCTYADCATSPPSGGGCGIGPELALLVPLLAGLRCRFHG